MNKLVLAAFAACLATSVSAKPQQMVVTGNPSLSSWVEAASRDVDSALERVDISRSETGITYVRFTCDEEGRPQNISTVKTRGYAPNLDRVGRQTISRIKTLHPMFDGAQSNQPVEAAIVIAEDQRQLDRLLAEVKDRARKQNAEWAARGAPNPVVSLAIVSGF
jgi:hypothetical protein